MKKTLAILLALVAVAGFAFADDAAPAAAKIGFYSEGHIVLVDQDSNTSIGPAWGQSPDGSYNTLTLSYAGENFGWTMTDVFGMGTFQNSMRDASAYYKFLDGKVKFVAGLTRDPMGVRLTDYINGVGYSTRLANAKTGFGFGIYPIPGLTICAYVPVPVADQAASDTYVKANFGLGYAIENVGKFVASYRLENEEAAGAFVFTGVEKLSANLGVKYVIDTATTIFVSADYSVSDPLEVAFSGDVVLPASEDMAFGVGVSATYAVASPVSVGILVAYDCGDAVFGNGEAAAAALEINPKIVYAFGNSSVQLGSDIVCNLADSTVAWNIPLTYVVSF